MAKYIVIKTTAGTIICIQREDGASIPVCEGNSDYQMYLADVAVAGPYPEEVISDPVPEDPSDHDLLMAIAEILEVELS